MSFVSTKVLLICPDSDDRRALLDLLGRCGVEPGVSSTFAEAESNLRQQPWDLILCEDQLPDGSFRDVLRTLKLKGSALPVIVSSRLDDMGEYLEAMQFGAFDFISAPYSGPELELIVERAIHESPASGRKPSLAAPARLRETSAACGRARTY